VSIVNFWKMWSETTHPMGAAHLIRGLILCGETKEGLIRNDNVLHLHLWLRRMTVIARTAEVKAW